MRRKVHPYNILQADQIEVWKGHTTLLKLMPLREDPHAWDGPLPYCFSYIHVRATEKEWVISLYSEVDSRSRMPQKKERKRVSIGYPEAQAVLMCMVHYFGAFDAYYRGTVLVHEAREKLGDGMGSVVQDAMDGEFYEDWLYKSTVAQDYCRRLVDDIVKGTCGRTARDVRDHLKQLRMV